MSSPAKQKLFLIFSGRFPSEKAASLFVAKNADAFERVGYDVTILVPQRKEVTENPYVFYDLSLTVRVEYLHAINLFPLHILSGLAYWIQTISFSLSTMKYLKRHASPDDMVYSNEPLPLLLASRRFPNTVYEMHDFPESKLAVFGMFIRRMHKVVIHNAWKTNEATKVFKLDPKRILTEPNAVDVEMFDSKYSRAEAREMLKLPQDKKIVVYTGHLYSWKGVDTLAQAAMNMPEIEYAFVGGTPDALEAYRSRYIAPNITWVGFRPHDEIPLWQRAADVLVLPNTAREAISALYTSPMKLYEYLASGTPVVASKITSVQEIVTDDTVRFAEADNAASFEAAIRDVLAATEESKSRALRGKEEVQMHTWDMRGERIGAFLKG